MQLQQTNIERYLSQLIGQPVQVERLSPLGSGAQGAEAIKAFGYGQPLSIEYHLAGQTDQTQRVILRQVKRNGFGHERDPDRVAEVWLNFTTFNHLPRHVAALDMVGVTSDDALTSLGSMRDLLLLTDYAPGTPYAEDLLRIRDEGACCERDVQRTAALARYLAEIHSTAHDDPLLWRRRLRDLVGDGEGIMGLTDSYPADFALVSAADLQAIETAANRWRWQLKPLTHRLCQVHGDFHPFNVLFDGETDLHLLDRSRGEWGEAADDLSCMAINYLFFSLQRYGELTGPFAQLYTTFWETYLVQRPDEELCRVIQPWFAWRTLVLASPQWYPQLADSARHKLITFARRVLAEEHFVWPEINRYLTP